MNEEMLRVSVAKFAGEVDRLRKEAYRLRMGGWRFSVPARRGELYGVVAEALHRRIVRATKLEGEVGDLRSFSLSSGAAGPEPDADGHTVMAGSYTGLGDSYMVRVHIREGASKEDTVAMLRKMADWLQDDWARLTDVERYEPELGPGDEFRPYEPGDLPF
jgi:hypothetical protein